MYWRAYGTIGAVLGIAACAQHPRPAMPRQVTAPDIFGDSTLVQVSASPRAGTWSDDLRVQAPVGSHVTIFDHSPRGAPRLRVVDGGAVRVSSSIHWRSSGAWSGGTPRRSPDDVEGQVVCRNGEFVPIGPGEEGYVRPVACVEHKQQRGDAPTLSLTHRAEPRAVMVIVSESAPRLAERAALLRRFARAQGVTSGLSELASEVVPPGRWVFVTHVPRR
jgi:hypothetical protein